MPPSIHAHMVDLGSRGLHVAFEWGPDNRIQLDSQFLWIPSPTATFFLMALGSGWKWCPQDWVSLKTSLDLGYFYAAVGTKAFHKHLLTHLNLEGIYAGVNLGCTFRIRISEGLYYPISLGMVLPFMLTQQIQTSNGNKDPVVLESSLLRGSIFFVPIPYIQVVGLDWN